MRHYLTGLLQMADGCWLRHAPLSPLPSPLSPLHLQPLSLVLSAQVFHALAGLLTDPGEVVAWFLSITPARPGGRGALCSTPGRRGTLCSTPGGRGALCTSLEVTTFAEARSPLPCTGGLRAPPLLHQSFSRPAERVRMLLRAISPSYRQGNPCQTQVEEKSFGSEVG